MAGRAFDSAAILSADGKPSQTIAVGKELSQGVILKEVHETYIIISEAGLTKRVELPQPTPIAGGQAGFQPGAQRGPNTPQTNFMNGPPPTQPQPPQQPQQPQPVPENSR